MGRGEGSSWWKGRRGTPLPGGDVQPDLRKVSRPWDFEGILCGHMYLCTQQGVRLSRRVGKPSNFRGAAPGCGGHGQGRGLSWGTGDTVCKGRTSAGVAGGFG